MNLRPHKVFNIPIFYKLLKKKGTIQEVMSPITMFSDTKMLVIDHKTS